MSPFEFIYKNQFMGTFALMMRKTACFVSHIEILKAETEETRRNNRKSLADGSVVFISKWGNASIFIRCLTTSKQPEHIQWFLNNKS